MTLGTLVFSIVWLGIVGALGLGIAAARWLRFKDDVVELARRDRRRAQRGQV